MTLLQAMMLEVMVVVNGWCYAKSSLQETSRTGSIACCHSIDRPSGYVERFEGSCMSPAACDKGGEVQLGLPVFRGAENVVRTETGLTRMGRSVVDTGMYFGGGQTTV
jgi:hypothetical protein